MRYSGGKIMEWIISSNLKQFRTDDAFRDLGVLDWFQTKSLKNVKKGDMIYVYLSSPIREIHWKCEVLSVNNMSPIHSDDEPYYNYDYEDVNQIGPFIELKAVHEFRMTQYVSYENLKKHGLTNKLMGPCKVVPELSKYLHKVEKRDLQNKLSAKQHKKLIEPLDDSHTLEEKEEQAMTMDIDSLRVAAEKRRKDKPSKKTVSAKQIIRDPYIAEYAKRRANGICQLCGCEAPFLDSKGNPYLESHHIKWLSNGGEDSIENTTALCPNCHRKMHFVADKKDIKYLMNKNHSTKIDN